MPPPPGSTMTTDIEIRSAVFRGLPRHRDCACRILATRLRRFAPPEAYLAALSVEEREAMWRSAFEEHPDRLVVASCEDRIVGFAAFGPSTIETPHRIAPKFTRSMSHRHIGRLASVVGSCSKHCAGIQAAGNTAASLWVLAENERAIRFYERAGFGRSAIAQIHRNQQRGEYSMRCAICAKSAERRSPPGMKGLCFFCSKAIR